MSLLDTVRGAVRIIDRVTRPLQGTVLFTKARGTDYEGAPIVNPRGPVKLKATIDWAQKQVRTPAGELTVTRATVQFLNIKALREATRGDGIGDDDVIVLPDGTTGPILDLGGFVDAGTGQPFATEVMLG